MRVRLATDKGEDTIACLFIEMSAVHAVETRSPMDVRVVGLDLLDEITHFGEGLGTGRIVEESALRATAVEQRNFMPGSEDLRHFGTRTDLFLLSFHADLQAAVSPQSKKISQSGKEPIVSLRRVLRPVSGRSRFP